MISKPSFKSLHIIGRPIKIEWEKDLKASNGESAWGLYQDTNQAIKFDSGFPTTEKFVEVLFHECLHALFKGMNIEMDDKAEESIVTTLGCGLVALLKDNPKLVKYLYEHL